MAQRDGEEQFARECCACWAGIRTPGQELPNHALPFRSPVSRPAAIAGSDSIGGRGHKSYDVGMPSGPSHRHGGGPTRRGAGPADLRADAGEDRNGPYVLHHVLHKRSVLSISKGDAASALEEENVRVRATPFLVALLVLSNDNSKAHARAPIAVLAGYAKS